MFVASIVLATAYAPIAVAQEEVVEIELSPTATLFSINAPEKIQKISVYGLAGNCIGSVNGYESYANIPACYLNITQPGVYVISVETSNGITSSKVAIK